MVWYDMNIYKKNIFIRHDPKIPKYNTPIHPRHIGRIESGQLEYIVVLNIVVN